MAKNIKVEREGNFLSVNGMLYSDANMLFNTLLDMAEVKQRPGFFSESIKNAIGTLHAIRCKHSTPPILYNTVYSTGENLIIDKLDSRFCINCEDYGRYDKGIYAFVKKDEIIPISYDVADYPEPIKLMDDYNMIELTASEFERVLNLVEFCATVDARKVIHSICIRMAEGHCVANGTNGKWVGEVILRGEVKKEIKIHRNFVPDLKKFFKNMDVIISYDGKVIKFTANDREAIIKEVEGIYPCCERVKPKESEYNHTLDISPVHKFLKEYWPVYKSGDCFIMIGDGLLRIKRDDGAIIHSMEFESNVRFVLAYRYLLMILNTGMTKFSIIDGMHPLKCEGNGYSAWLMPLRKEYYTSPNEVAVSE